MLSNLAILEKTYELILWLYPAVNKFPKSQRFVLGQRMENAAIEILGKIIIIKRVRPLSKGSDPFENVNSKIGFRCARYFFKSRPERNSAGAELVCAQKLLARLLPSEIFEGKSRPLSRSGSIWNCSVPGQWVFIKRVGPF